MALLDVRDLKVLFPARSGMAEAVRGVDLAIEPGESVGVLGESGSGKSATALALMGLLPSSAICRAERMEIGGTDLQSLDPASRRRLRGREMSMVFQDPQSALNPAFTIGTQMIDVLTAHLPVRKAQARSRVLEILDHVGLKDAERVTRSYPHQLSGGMRQRVMIAMALLCEPKLLIADEPTTALDVTVQAQIVELLKRLRKELNLTLLFISHNLDLLAELCDRAVVMYAGSVVEEGATDELMIDPQHPYTKMLLDCVPRISDDDKPLSVIPGAPPSINDPIAGCAFHPRCDIAVPQCQAVKPELIANDGRSVRCWESGNV